MAYTPIYEKPYENGWEDLPSEVTPMTAEILDQYDDTFEHIEEYLEEETGGSEVTITPTLQSGTKIADYEIDGVSGALYAPAGGGGISASVLADPHSDMMLYAEGSFVTYNNKLYRAKFNGTMGDFDILDWEEVIVSDSLLLIEDEVAHGIIVSDGEVLQWSASHNRWEPGQGGGGSSTLAGLTDTTITSPTDGQFLVYNGTTSKWVNQTVPSAESENF